MEPTPPSPDDFEALRRLLALKRHEKPPPGYFEDFSARVMARIEAEEHMRARSWIDQLRDLFQAGRAFSQANLIAASGFVFVGAGLFLVLNPRNPSRPTADAQRVVVEQPFAAGIPTRATWEPFVALHLAPASQDPETNEVPKDLFTLPRLGQFQGARVDSPSLLMRPWIYSSSNSSIGTSPRR
jgi:hypothetical protein